MQSSGDGVILKKKGINPKNQDSCKRDIDWGLIKLDKRILYPQFQILSSKVKPRNQPDYDTPQKITLSDFRWEIYIVSRIFLCHHPEELEMEMLKNFMIWRSIRTHWKDDIHLKFIRKFLIFYFQKYAEVFDLIVYAPYICN
jgi:hypothetical protein